jgi:ATP-dependent helicase/nuclease subunit A
VSKLPYSKKITLLDGKRGFLYVLVLVYPDHLELLDYKTDRRKAESDFLRAYRAQLNLYAIAIEKRFAPKKVTYKGIYSFVLGKLIEA